MVMDSDTDVVLFCELFDLSRPAGSGLQTMVASGITRIVKGAPDVGLVIFM
jgi:hypothetical protein